MKNDFENFKSKVEDEEAKILSKISDRYDINQIDDIIYSIRKEFYVERPVDITTFIYSPEYLGNSLGHVFFPIWHRLLKKIHPSPFVNNFYEIILEAPLGSGKSYVSAVSILYEVYKLICLRYPQDFYNLGTGTRIYFIIFSVTLDSADINWNYIKTWMSKSPFFQNLGKKMSKAQKLSHNEQDIFNDIYISIGSNTDHSISRAIFGGQLDEGNFQKKSNNQAYENYDALVTRMESRFASSMGTPHGVLWLTSSPTLESSFTTERIQASKKTRSTLVVENIPMWEVLKGTDRHRKIYKSGKHFYVFTGDSVRDPFVINSMNKAGLLAQDTKNIIKVPLEHLEVFERNTAKALRDNAGRRILITSNLFDKKDELKTVMTNINKVKTRTDERFIDLHEPLGNTGTGIVRIGMKSSQKVNLIDNLDMSYFKNIMYPESYRRIHIDIGAKIDRCGISSSLGFYRDTRYYQTTSELQERTQRYILNDFAFGLEAFEGDEIPFSALVDLFVFLKKNGYPIAEISTDQREGGRKLRQDLEQQGFECSYFSMDADRNEYDEFQTLIFEQRAILCDVPLAFLELSELQDNGSTGKKPIIDHPKYFSRSLSPVDGAKPVKGSKDISDAIAGSVLKVYRSKHIFNPVLLYTKAQALTQNVNNIEKMYHGKMINNFSSKLWRGK